MSGLDDSTVAEAARLIAAGSDVEGLLTGMWSDGAQALRRLAAGWRQLQDEADDVEDRVLDAAAKAREEFADHAEASLGWRCHNPDCERFGVGRETWLVNVVWNCDACKRPMDRVVAP